MILRRPRAHRDRARDRPVVWIDSYQPLAYGNSYDRSPGSVDAPAGDSASVVFHKGRPFQFGLEIRNTGRFAVRVLGVPREVSDFFKARLLVNRPNPAENEVPLERFRPFDLKPGETRWLV